jgi:ATP-dependent Clp protease adapter protein ClpS
MNRKEASMPKVILHPTLRGLSGKMGDVVFRTNRRTGRTTISKVPDMTKVKWSKAQKAQRRRFKKAVACARTAMTQPEVWAVYQALAKKKRKRAWDLAVSDHYHGTGLVAIK